MQRDAARDEFLASRSFVVLRFWDNDVLRTPMAVLGAIAQAVHMLRKQGRSQGCESRKESGAFTRPVADLSYAWAR